MSRKRAIFASRLASRHKIIPDTPDAVQKIEEGKLKLFHRNTAAFVFVGKEGTMHENNKYSCMEPCDSSSA